MSAQEPKDFTDTASFRRLVSGDEEMPALTREGLVSAITNAIEFAHVSQRFVGLLVIRLERPDKLESIVGTPTREVLKVALARLPDGMRPVDKLLDVADDKIIALLPNLRNTAQAWLAAGKVQRILEESFVVNGQVVAVRPVVGIATYPDHAELAEELVVHADIAASIAASRDVAQHVFQQEDRRDSDIYLGLENPLREAIRLNQLELHFQPQVLLASGRATSAEALLRWNAPEIGTVSPATVVRIAEASGVIGALSNWIINSAFRQQATWVKNGAPINLSLNLSTINLTDHELPEVVQQALGTWNIDPTTVTFEITESATIGDAEKSITVLQRLKDLGVNIALDDFGTGYSSMSYLKNFPLDELKIDRTFVQQLQLSSADQRIVRSVIALAHDFRLTVVAEGVEDESTAKELRRMGCDLSQGYFHSPALPSDAFIEWMAKHT